MSVQLVKFFEEISEEDVRLRFWFKEIKDSDEPISMYVKEIFINPDGSLLALGLGYSKEDSRWEYYRWDTAAKFRYADEDQAEELQQ